MKMAVIQEDKCCRVVYRMDGDDGNWMLTSNSVGGLRLPDDFPKAFSLSPQHLREYVQRHRANYQICRSMFLRASGFSGRVFCDAQGWSHYHEQNDELGDLNTVFYLGRMPKQSSQVYEELQRQAQDPDSSFSFALDFHRMPFQEKVACLFGFSSFEEYRSAQKELDSVLRWVLQLRPWTDQEPLCWNLATRPGSQQAQWLDTTNIPYLKKWQDVLRRFGPLQPQLSNASLRHFYEGHSSLSQVVVEPPTAHEQLEAHLQLREWTQTHLPRKVCGQLERLES